MALSAWLNGNLRTVTRAKSEDPNETPQNAFHQDLHCLLTQKQFSGTELQYNYLCYSLFTKK